MAIQIRCECGKIIRANDGLAGSRIPCRVCKRSVLLPEAGTNLVPEAEIIETPKVKHSALEEALARGRGGGKKVSAGKPLAALTLPPVGREMKSDKPLPPSKGKSSRMGTAVGQPASSGKGIPPGKKKRASGAAKAPGAAIPAKVAKAAKVSKSQVVRLGMLIAGGVLLIGGAAVAYVFLSADDAPAHIASLGGGAAATSPTSTGASGGASSQPANQVEVLHLDGPPRPVALVPAGLPPRTPESVPLPTSGPARDLLQRVADAYRGLTTYQDQTTIAVEDSVDFRQKSAGETTDVSAHSLQTFSGTVAASRPDHARLSFQLDGNCTFALRESRERGLNPSTQQALDWALNSSNRYDAFYDGSRLWMTTAVGELFQSGAAAVATTQSAPVIRSAVQIRRPDNEDDIAGKLLKNGYGFELPLDRRWLKMLFVKEPMEVLKQEIGSVNIVGSQLVDGDDCDLLSWVEPVSAKLAYRGVRNLSVPARAWIRRKDSLIVKVVRDGSAVYPWVKEPVFASVLFAGLPPEARSGFKRVVTETHRAINIDKKLEPSTFAYAGDPASHPIPIVHVEVVDESGAPVPGAGAMLRNLATGLRTEWHATTDADIQFDAEDFRWRAASPGFLEKGQASLFSESGNQVVVRAPGFATSFTPLPIDWKNPHLKVALSKGRALTMEFHRADGSSLPSDAEPILFQLDDLAAVTPARAYAPAPAAAGGSARWSVTSQSNRAADGSAMVDLIAAAPFNRVTPVAHGENELQVQLPAELISPLYLWLTKGGVQPVVAGPFGSAEVAGGKLSIELPATGSLDASLTASGVDASKLKLSGIGLVLSRALPEALRPVESLAVIDARSADFSTAGGGSVHLAVEDLAAGTYTLTALGETGGIASELFHRTLTLEPGKGQTVSLDVAESYRGTHQIHLGLFNSDGTPLVGKLCVLTTVGGSGAPVAQAKTGTSGRAQLRGVPGGTLNLMVDGKLFNTIEVEDSDSPQEIELQAAPSRGQSAADFAAIDAASGQTVHLADLKGKAVLLEFLPEHAGADQLASLRQLLTKHKQDWGTRLTTLVVCFDDAAAAKALLTEPKGGAAGGLAASLQIWLGGASVAGAESGKRYQLGAFPLPRQMLLDGSGIVVAGGAHQAEGWNLESAVSSVLAPK